jgi:ribosome-binding factor A
VQNYKRSVRVAELIQQEISKIIPALKNPKFGFITITAVKLTDDLQECRVYYSVLGGPDEVEANRILLDEALPKIRYQLAQRINLRRTPTLEFKFDDTPERANKVFAILEKIKAEEKKTE